MTSVGGSEPSGVIIDASPFFMEASKSMGPPLLPPPRAVHAASAATRHEVMRKEREVMGLKNS